MRKILFVLALLLSTGLHAQDTTIVQTLTYDSTGRSYVFDFPVDIGQEYEKIIMEYSMRCKDGLVSTGTNTNLGCGEWDYSCNTYLTDSSYIDSTMAVHPSHIISGFSGSTYDYTTIPTYNYIRSFQEEVIYTETVSEVSAEIGFGSIPSMTPFSANNSKVQYLVKASELLAGGLTAGNITGMRVDLTNLGSILDNLRIKIKGTSAEILDESKAEFEGFTTVYYLNTNFSNVGSHQFNFSNNFAWDGTENLIVEFTHNGEAGAPSTINSETIENHGIASFSDDFSLQVTGNSYVSIPSLTTPPDNFTIEWWAYPNSLKAWNQSLAAGSDWGGFRYHTTPNGGVYIGTDVNTRLTPTNIPDGTVEVDKWQHFAFTFENGTGKFYKNGILLATKSGMLAPVSWNGFTIGVNSATSSIDGKVDEVRIWNEALTLSSINDYLYKSVDTEHQNFSDLLAYYKFNDGAGDIVIDETGGHNGSIQGAYLWRNKVGVERNNDFISLSERPNFEILQGEYTSTVNSTTIDDSLINLANTVLEYEVNGTDLELSSTNYYYQSGYSYVYDEQSGLVVDSVLNTMQNSIEITELDYFNKWPSKFEIMSFVTPYGINLDLGPNGKMWQFDVTDFTPILKDSKRLSVEFAGRYQEDLDIRFLFISGTPPRNVIDIQQLWRAGIYRSYTNIINDAVAEPRNVQLNADASYYKIRTSITGHGQEGEFIPRTHFINIDGGPNELSWQAWKECADNPIFPQGGTWIYDRAGWCPGSPTDIVELDFSDMVTPGQTVTIDYGLNTASGTSNYLVNSQLVTYGEANFTLDAAILEVQRPSNRIEFDRVNPICYNPIIKIQNTGSSTLTSLTINYNVVGAAPLVYEWTGNLAFMETEEITLPIGSESFWIGSATQVFEVSVSAPNGGSDQYSNNNKILSPFILPDIFNEPFVIRLTTNNNASENSYVLKDDTGNVILSKSGLSNNTIYTDTIDLEKGCYTLELEDTGNDGLSFWANSAQGTGSLRFVRTNIPFAIKVFEPDFGKSIHYAFSVGTTSYINEAEKENSFEVYPNPTNSQFNVELSFSTQTDVQIVVHDALGRLIDSQNSSNFKTGSFSFDLHAQSNGIYYCTVISESEKQTKKIVINR